MAEKIIENKEALEDIAELMSQITMMKKEVSSYEEASVKKLGMMEDLAKVESILSKKSSEHQRQIASSILERVSAAQDLLTTTKSELPYHNELAKVEKERLKLAFELENAAKILNGAQIRERAEEKKQLDISYERFKMMQKMATESEDTSRYARYELQSLEERAELSARLNALARVYNQLGIKSTETLKGEALIARARELMQSKDAEIREEEIKQLLDAVDSTKELLQSAKEELPYQEDINEVLRRRNVLTTMLASDSEVLTGKVRQQYASELESNKLIEKSLILMQERAVVTKKHNELLDRSLGIFGKTTDEIKSIGVEIVGMLRNPLIAIVALLGLAVKRFLDMQRASTEFRKETGLTVAQTKDLEKIALKVEKNLGKWGVGFDDSLTAIKSLFFEFKRLNLVTEENIQFVSKMAKDFGVAEDASAKFLKNMYLIGANAEKTRDAIKNIAITSGVSVSALMTDIAESSGEMYEFLAKSRGGFIRAAGEAHKLGLSMKQISDMNEGLLDIETSLSDEMEAQLLTGKSLNLDAARYFALIGDQEGALNAVVSQFGSINEFNKLGPLAMRSYAKAVNLSVDALATAIKLRGEDLKLSPEQRREAEKLTRENQTIQDTVEEISNQWKMVFRDVSILLLPTVVDLSKILLWIFKLVVSIGRGLQEYVSGGWLVAIGVGVVLFMKMGSIVSTIASMWKGISASIIFTKNAMGSLLSGKLPKMSKGRDISDYYRTGSEKQGAPTSTRFDKFSKFLKDAKPQNILASAAAMVLIAGAIYILAKAMQEFSTGVTWDGVAKGTASIAGLTAVTYALSKIQNDVIKGAASLAILGGALYIIGTALKSFVGLDWKQLALAGAAIGGLVGVTYTLGKMQNNIIKGAASLAVLGGALYVVGTALQSFVGLDWKQLALAGAAIGGLALVMFGLSNVGAKAVVGAASLIIMGGALYVIGDALKSFVGLDWKQLALAGAAIGGLALVMFGLSTIAVQAVVGAAALIIMGGALYVIGDALKSFVGLDWKQLALAGAAIGGLTLVMFGLSTIAVQAVVGAAALAIMGGALYILGSALKVFNEISWEGLAKAAVAIVGLSAAVFGLGALMFTGVGALVFGAGIFAITSLGVAFSVLGASMALVAMSADPILNFIRGLSQVDYASLLKSAGALTAVGAGLSTMAVGSAVAGVVDMLFGKSEEITPETKTQENDKTDIVIERLNKLIDVIEKKQFVANLDGRKVSKELGYATQY